MPKNNVLVELFFNGVWNDITGNDDVFTDSPITLMHGPGEDGKTSRPCQISMRLDNADDKYRISNPQSPFYRLIGRATLIRVTVNDSVRAIGEINSWKCDQTPEFRQTPRRGKAWTDITAAGKLFRVNTWNKNLRSSLFRYNTLAGYTLAEYWDMEVASGGSEAPSVVGGAPLKPVLTPRYVLPNGSVIPPGGAPDFGSGDGIPGSDSLPSFQGGGTLRAAVRKQTFDGYAIDFVLQFEINADAGGTTSCDVLNWTESGTYVSFTVNVVKDSVTVFHSNAADAATFSATGSASVPVNMYDGTAHQFRYQVRQNGGSYSATLYESTGYFGVADNFVPGMTGTVGIPKIVQWNPLEDHGSYMPIAAGHLAIWASGQLGLQPTGAGGLNGNSSEKTPFRLFRVLSEENISSVYDGDTSLCVRMGVQHPGTLVELVEEFKITEDAILYDNRDTLDIAVKLRTNRYNQTPVLTLYPTDFPALPLEVMDNSDVQNIITATQSGGGEATAEDSTSFLSTQDSPDGVGEQKYQVDVNLYTPNTDLIQHANWWMRRGTVDLPRYPVVELDLNASPHLVPYINDLRPGDVIQILNMRENIIRLHILGWTETVSTHARKLLISCKADQQFVVGTYNGTTTRYDLRSCTLSGAHSINTTTLSLTMSENEVWSATSAYELIIAGEVVYIPIGAMGARAGSGPYTQTATGVTRAVNGISKILPSGSEVHVTTPGRWAL